MAWGMFCRLPCPHKVWDENGRTAMLKMFPLIGLMIGVLVSICWWLLDIAGLPAILSGVIVTILCFWMTGYIHMDGFMDCCDAILSRRPDPEERQRILKDSTVGAFAVISIVFAVLLFAASNMALCQIGFTVEGGVMLPLIFMVSRTAAVRDVMTKKPMESSQYREVGVSDTAIPVVVTFLAAVFGSLTIYFAGGNPAYVLLAGFAVAVEKFAGTKARKDLGGMNGDISGYMITIGEVSGVLLMAAVMCLTV